MLWILRKIICWPWIQLIKLRKHIAEVLTMKLCKTRISLHPGKRGFKDLRWGGGLSFLNISIRNQVIKGQERSMRSFLQKLWQNRLKSGLKKFSLVTKLSKLLFHLVFFSSNFTFEVNISIVMNPIVLHFLNSSEQRNSIYILLRVLRDYFEEREKAETIGT